MSKIQKTKNRRRRVRAKVRKNDERPRLSVHKSNKYIYAQIIDDTQGKTVASANSLDMKKSGIEAATKVGKEIAEKAKKAKITQVVFDRGSNKYHGRVKALAEAARENGLDF